MSVLKLENVSIRYLTGDFKDIGLKEYVLKRARNEYKVHEFWADRHVSFALEKGDMLGIIGANGAGKSTLLKAISGIMEPTEGRVERRGSIAALLELASGFDGELTVKENAYLRGAMLGYTRQYMDESYEKIIDFAELREFQDRPFKQLSSGMKSRLAFSIASMVNPDILILDEVLSVGDGAFRKKSEAKMREIIEGGATTILVSHSIEQIRKMCNKVLWLHKGQQVEYGEDVQGICDRYEEFLDGKRKIDVRPEKAREIPKNAKADSEEKQNKENTATNENVIRITGKNRLTLFSRYFSLWDSLSGWRLFLFYLLHYTALFVVMWLICFAPFTRAGKTLIWTQDAMPQEYTYLIYLKTVLQEGFRSLLTGNGWAFPLYDFRVMPAKTSLQFDLPLYLSVLWNGDNKVLYDILAEFRVYLAGIAFSLLGFRYSKKAEAVLASAITYAFCSYTLSFGTEHPPFLSAMIYMPLLILGLEKILKNEKPYLFTLSICAALLGSVYLAAIMACLLLLFAVISLIDLRKEYSRKEMLRTIRRILVDGLIGIILSGVILIPSLIMLLDTGRAGQSSLIVANEKNLFVAPLAFIKRFVSSFSLSGGSATRETYLGFPILALPLMIVLFFQRKREARSIRFTVVILTLMMLCPIVGYILSGFNAFVNRWSFVYALFIAIAELFALAELLTSFKRYRILTGVLLLVNTIICTFVLKTLDFKLIGIILLLVILYACMTLFFNQKRKFAVVCVILTCVSCWYTAFSLFDSHYGGFIRQFANMDDVDEYYLDSQYESFSNSKAYDDTDVFRVACSSLPRESINSSFMWDINGINTYNSLMDNSFIDWLNDLETADRGMLITHFGPDGRSGVMSLSNIKYLVIRDGSDCPVPYGFEALETVQNEQYIDTVYENQYWLPIGYTYSSFVSQQEYDDLSALERQEKQLETVFLSEDDVSASKSSGFNTDESNIPWMITEMDGVRWEDGILYADKNRATIELSFEGLPEHDTYLRINNLNILSGGNQYVTASSKYGSSTALFCEDAYRYDHELRTQILNLGYSEDGTSTCTICFRTKGSFTIDSLEIWCFPVENYDEWIESLRREPLENVETNWRGLTGSISVSTDKILCLSIPYDEGWTAYVDGKKTDLMRANTAWMAIELSAGEHEIELLYWTPGLTAGICLTVLGIIALICCILYDRKKKSSGKQMSILEENKSDSIQSSE